jgi:hypothetical protein
MVEKKYRSYQNIGSDYRYFKLIIRLTISIIDYRTALLNPNPNFLYDLA